MYRYPGQGAASQVHDPTAPPKRQGPFGIVAAVRSKQRPRPPRPPTTPTPTPTHPARRRCVHRQLAEDHPPPAQRCAGTRCGRPRAPVPSLHVTVRPAFSETATTPSPPPPPPLAPGHRPPCPSSASTPRCPAIRATPPTLPASVTTMPLPAWGEGQPMTMRMFCLAHAWAHC